MSVVRPLKKEDSDYHDGVEKSVRTEDVLSALAGAKKEIRLANLKAEFIDTNKGILEGTDIIQTQEALNILNKWFGRVKK